MHVKPDRSFVRAALASGLLLSAAPAFMLRASPAASAQSETAGKGMKLLKMTVTGNQRVPTADIEQAMTVHVGDRVTRTDLAANLNAIVDVYRKANVGAGFKQRMTIPRPGQVLVAYMIEEQAPPPPQAAAVLQADKVTFEGNKRITSDAIQSVITLKPGDPVDSAKVSANMAAILALYKKANVGVQISPSATYPQPNHVVLDYKIDEKASPRAAAPE